MASLSAVSMAKPITTSFYNTTLFSPLPMKPQRVSVLKQKLRSRTIKASAHLKENVVTGFTAAALTASMMYPDVAQAAELSPSFKNFLLSIGAGGVVLVGIIGAVVAVSNFDPVKRV